MKKENNTVDGKKIDSKKIEMEANKEHSTTVEHPTIPKYTFSWGGYIKAVGTLFFVLIFLGMVLIILRRKGVSLNGFFKSRMRGKTKDKEYSLIVEQRYTIDQRKSLIVVQFLNKKLLLGVTDASINVLVEEREEGIKTHEQNVEEFNVLMENVRKESGDTT